MLNFAVLEDLAENAELPVLRYNQYDSVVIMTSEKSAMILYCGCWLELAG